MNQYFQRNFTFFFFWNQQQMIVILNKSCDEPIAFLILIDNEIGGAYIHSWRLQAFSQDYDLASHTTNVVYINCIHEWRDIQFKVDSVQQVFDGNFIYSQSFSQKPAERKSHWVCINEEQFPIYHRICRQFFLLKCIPRTRSVDSIPLSLNPRIEFQTIPILNKRFLITQCKAVP